MDLTSILLITGFVFVVLVLLAVVFGPMFGWQFPAKHEEFVAFNSDLVPRDKIREAVRELGWTLDSEAPDGMVARTKVNWRSWGEIVSLGFRERGAEVRSECAFPLQAIDYGRNRMNVRSLIHALKKKSA